MRVRIPEGESPLSTGQKRSTQEASSDALTAAVKYYLSLWKIVSEPGISQTIKQKTQAILKTQTTKIGLVLAKAESSGQDEATLQTLQHLYRYALELTRRNSLAKARQPRETNIYTSNVYGYHIKNR